MYEEKRVTSIGRWLNPDYIVFKEIERFLPSEDMGCVLDYGAGNSPYRSFISCKQYLTADVTQNISNDIDYIIQPGERLPLNDASVDLVLLIDVLEHVSDVSFVFSELRRLLKPTGRVVISIPFMYREHETPRDFVRYTSFGIHTLCQQYGGRIQRIRKVGNVLYTLSTLFLERNIVNGEVSNIGVSGKVINRLMILLQLLFRPIFACPPDDNAGIYHHLLVEVCFP